MAQMIDEENKMLDGVKRRTHEVMDIKHPEGEGGRDGEREGERCRQTNLGCSYSCTGDL